MNENEDGTGSPTSSSFLIPIPSLTSNNTPRDFNIKNSKIFYIKISFINFLLISHLIFVLHIIMTFNDFLIIFLTVIIGILINLFINRDRTYVVFLKDIENNLNSTLVVKALSKRKAYDVVSKYLIKQKLSFIISDITNTVIFDNNDVICSNIYIIKK